MKKLAFLVGILLGFSQYAQDAQFKKELEKINRNPNLNQRIDSLEKFTKYWVFEDPVNALIAAKQLYSLTKNIKNSKAFLTSYNALGLASLYIDKNEVAIKYFDTLVKISESRRDTVFQAKAHGNLGLIYERLAKYKIAFSEYSLSLKFAELSKNTSQVASSFGNMGNVSIRLNQCKEAIVYLSKSAQLFKELNNLKALGNQYNSMSQAYDGLDDNANEEKYLRKAEKIYREIAHFRALGTVLTNLGSLESENGNYKGAIVILEEALKLKSSVEEQNGAATVMVNLANAYGNLGQFDKAYAHLISAEKIARSQNDLFLQSELLKKRAFLLRMRGKHEQAYDMILDYLKLNDSVMGRQTQQAVAEFKEKYESEKKEFEIERLTKEGEIDNLKIKQNEVELAKEKAQRNLIIGVLIFIVALFVVLIWFFIQKRKSSRVLEIKNRQLEKANIAILRQKEEITEKQKEILDSIHYAKRIQTALMSNERYITKSLTKLRNN